MTSLSALAPCPVRFGRRRGHPGKATAGEPEPRGPSPRRAGAKPGRPIARGATQAGELQAGGGRSGPGGGDVSRAVRQMGGKPWTDLGWATLPLQPCRPLPRPGTCGDPRAKAAWGPPTYDTFVMASLQWKLGGALAALPPAFCMRCSSPAQQFPAERGQGLNWLQPGGTCNYPSIYGMPSTQGSL